MKKYLSRVKTEDIEIELKDKKMPSNAEVQQPQSEKIEETVYSFCEVSKIIDEGVSKEGLEAIHKVKKAFSGSKIEIIENE